MKKFLISLIILLLISPVLSPSYYAAPVENETFQEINLSKVNNRQIMLKTIDKNVYQDYGLELSSSELGKHNIFFVRVPEHKNYQHILESLQKDNRVLVAEPDYFNKPSFIPSDPYYSQQTYAKDINLHKAWDITRGSEDVIVAVLDTGVNANHPDLVGRVLPGFDFVNNDEDSSDDQGHGTYVAGIIAANANSIGTTGVDHHAKILPIKIFGTDGQGSISDTVKGIYYAIEQGADIINMSYRSFDRSDIQEEALEKAYKQGITLIASTGNDSSGEPTYPAAYQHVIAVTAKGENGEMASFSNYGKWTDITAPGTKILTTSHEDGYVQGDGTSFAAPIVSGVAALIKSLHPDWGPREIEWALELTAQSKNGEEWNAFDGYGLINAHQALIVEFPDLSTDASDTWEWALEITESFVLEEKMDLPQDVDWFKLIMETESEIDFIVSNIASHLDLEVDVYRLENDSIQLIENVNITGMGEEESFSFTANPGEYYLEVKDVHGHWSKTPYSLILNLNPVDELLFPDLQGNWARDEITFLAERQVITGYPNGYFGVTDHIDRASAAAIITRDLDLPLEKSNLKDVPNNHWASEYIGAAVKEGFLTGYPDGTFRPNDPLTRSELAAILVRAYDLKGETKVAFKDANQFQWADKYITTLVANGITNGFPDGTYRPNAKISRAEFSVMVARVMDDSFKVK